MGRRSREYGSDRGGKDRVGGDDADSRSLFLASVPSLLRFRLENLWASG